MKWLPILIIFSVLLLDQITKITIVENFTLNDKPIEVIGDYLRIRFIENPGMAFGILADLDKKVKDLLFTSLTVIAIGVVVYYYKIAQKKKVVIKSALAMILGGALGNLSDKVFGDIIFNGNMKFFYGKVVDFIDVGIGDNRWPTFNIADIAITVGVFLLLILILFNREEDFFSSSKTKS